MADKSFLKQLSSVEKAALDRHLEAVKDHRDEANVHAKWAKQIIDRARARMKATEAKA